MGSDVWIQLVGAMAGAAVGAGVPAIIALVKFAAAWGALNERVDANERDIDEHRRRLRVVEQRTSDKPGLPASRPRGRTW